MSRLERSKASVRNIFISNTLPKLVNYFIYSTFT